MESGSAAPAVFPVFIELAYTRFISVFPLILGFYTLYSTNVLEVFSCSSQTRVKPNKHVVHCISKLSSYVSRQEVTSDTCRIKQYPCIYQYNLESTAVVDAGYRNSANRLLCYWCVREKNFETSWGTRLSVWDNGHVTDQRIYRNSVFKLSYFATISCCISQNL